MSTESTDDVLIKEAEERLFAAIKAQDIPALEAELTEDFVHSALGGAENDRQAFLEGIRNMPYRVLELSGQDLRVRILGDMALLAGIQQARVALDEEKNLTARTAFVDVFVRTGEGWRLRHAVELPEAEVESEGADGQ
jgi:ketosteroid isomerase-like protein